MLPSASTVFVLFREGGIGFMSILTLLLIAMFFAAWKAPAWVREIGLIALAFGFLGTVLGFLQIGDVLSANSDIASNIIWGGVKVTLITTIYGIIIYIVSLILRIIQKPRI